MYGYSLNFENNVYLCQNKENRRRRKCDAIKFLMKTYRFSGFFQFCIDYKYAILYWVYCIV